MKMLTAAVTSPVAVAATTATQAATPAATPAATTMRRPRLPRDAVVQFNSYPPELYLNMTITRVEHFEALMEALNTFAPQLQSARHRDDDR